MPCVDSDGQPARKTVVKYNTFRITIKRLPKSGGHNRDSVKAEFKIDRFGIIKQHDGRDVDQQDPAEPPLQSVAVSSAHPGEPIAKSRRLKRRKPAPGTLVVESDPPPVPLRVVAETWGPTSGRSKFHQRYLHVEFSNGETVLLVAEDLHPTSSTPSRLVESNPFYTHVVHQWRQVNPHPVSHPE
jgi:hypothetical protein